MRVLLLILSLISFSLHAGTASAGPGTVVHACVNLDVTPLNSINVSFTADENTDICMNDVGNDSSLTIDHAGIECVSVGYVEAESSCSGGAPVWSLSYHTDNYAQSGTTITSWSDDNSRNTIQLIDPSKGTHICPTEANCEAESLSWDEGTTGPVYIIFDID
ncbi:hypothetical protein [Pseudovibrio sp. FO-BEG1]|uniref:hypothetical protein n=1 Tax=Pseudovibrio sp. (strain FO-BEG1) TaxID=911045 RepID=UPI0011D2B788|nr:hypothetical protein [Pseudovibrio sp. FO-BEG1]